MPFDLAGTIARAADALGRSDFAEAETAAQAALAQAAANADALHILGLVRVHQGRLNDGLVLLAQAIQAQPGHPRLLLNFGRTLAALGEPGHAIAALSDAVRYQPDFAEAWFELGSQQRLVGQSAATEASWRRALAHDPAHGPARLALGQLLLELGRPAEAEQAVAENAADNSVLAECLYVAQRQQHKREAALATAALVQALDPSRTGLDDERFDLLQELGRHDEALALMATMLARDPADPQLHWRYNDTLHLLGLDEQMFASYDAAPPLTSLLVGKANLLLETGRTQEALDAYEAALAREPENTQVLVSLASALAWQGRAHEATALMEKALARQPEALPFLAGIGNAALLAGDAAKAAAMLEKVIAAAPHEHSSLARLSTAWRLLGDPRDEMLMGYDTLVRVFDLEPPSGFSDMAAFNAELQDYLAGLHPHTRAYLGQSLRGGTQTSGHLFGGGHVLVERLKARIDQAVARYIGELPADPAHPLHGRRTHGFAYNGSWSSRLSDCGFHTNHIHPMGWISSCYYVGLPATVADEEAKQGWIKFGEPGFDVGLSFRRAVQPKLGRLVLFPSYMWHGTIPFQGSDKRTTIAFDVVPV